MNENTFHKSIGIPLSILGFIGLYIGVFTIPMSEMGTCTMASSDGWLISIIFGLPLCIISTLLCFLGIKSKKFLRWFTLPLALLITWAYFVVFRYIVGVTFAGEHMCSIASGFAYEGYPIEPWFKYWGPIQCCSLLFTSWLVIRYWFGNDTANKLSQQDAASGAAA